MLKKELIEQRAKLIMDAQAIANGKDFDQDKQVEVEKMLAKAKELQARIAVIEQADREAAALNKPNELLAGREGNLPYADSEKAQRAMLYNTTFDKMLRQGRENLTEGEKEILRQGYQAPGQTPQNALSVATPASGGYTVPQDFQSNMEVAIKKYLGVVEAGAQVITTGNGQDLPWPTANDTGNKGRIITEGGSTSGVDPSFGQTTMKSWIYTSDVILVSLALLQDTGVDLIGYLAAAAADRVGRVQNEHYTTGDNTGKPQGLIPAIPGGATVTKSGSFSAASPFGFDDIAELKFKVDKGYRDDSVFMCSDTAQLVITKIKDGENRPLFLPSARDGEPDRLLNRPLYWNNEMAAPAVNAIPLVFGDMSKYKVRNVAGDFLARVTEPYITNYQVAFIYFKRSDGRLINAGTNPIAALKMPAS